MAFRKFDNSLTDEQHTIPSHGSTKTLVRPEDGESAEVLPASPENEEYEMLLACLDDFEVEHIFVRNSMKSPNISNNK